MKFRMLMVTSLLTVSTMVFCNSAKAERPALFARNIADDGMLAHDGTYNGKENVFQMPYNGFGARIIAQVRARQAWRRSPAHRQNLPMFWVRTAKGPNGTFAVGR